MKLVHAADLHLDSPLCGLDRYDGAPVDALRGASRRALERLVGKCVEEGASLLLIAGDLYDGAWRDYKTGLYFAAQMAKLKAAGVRVALVSGNHDAESAIAKNLRLPDNVRALSTRKPETVVYDDLGVAVHGQGFAARSVTDDLAARYPARVGGLFNVGLLHTCANGRPGHESYAPTSLATLRAKGYDYWALGHVHTREVLCEDPWIVFPGNLQGRSLREAGPKGATLVHVGDGSIEAVEHVPLDVVRFALAEVDARRAASGHDVVDLARDALARALEAADGRLAAVRVSIEGESRAHAALAAGEERWAAEIRAAAMDLGGGALWVEGVRVRTRAALDPDALRARDDALGQLARSLDALRGDEAELRQLLASLDDVRQKLPPELAHGEDALDLDDPRLARELVDDVAELLLGRLTSDGRAQ